MATDTYSTMQRLHQIISTNPCFSHVIMVLCDSHGLQLLIETIIIKHEDISRIIEKTQSVVATFAQLEVQLAILMLWTDKKTNSYSF